MLPSIQFNDYFLFKTDKINNIWAYRLLSLEFEPCETFSS